MQYLIVILDEAANSFCYYPNPTGKTKLMDLELLRKVIFFAQKEGWLINFLLGKKTLPKEYKEAIDVINHILITPPEFPQDDVNDVLVVDYDNKNDYSNVPNNPDKNIILRIEKCDLKNLFQSIKSLQGKYRRVNISIQNINLMTDDDFETYRVQLQQLTKLYRNQPAGAEAVEINVLFDRFFLRQMNNCDAGVKHITFAPNGKFYICPAFYYEDENNFVGDLQNGLNIKNRQLYRLDHAPICRNCDAFHCKRCIWLNRKTTLEVNTPSHEQCVVAHLERETSRNLLTTIRETGTFLPETDIPELDYLDPFEKNNRWK